MRRPGSKASQQESLRHTVPVATLKRWWISAFISLGNVYRRLLAMFFAIIGPQLAYRMTAWGARRVYNLLDTLRLRSEAQAKAALSTHVPAGEIPHIAARAFIHRTWNLTDLMLASWRLNAATYDRRGGRIAEPFLSRLLQRQKDMKATILLSPYYGSFDLLPIFLGYNGIRATVIYRPHANRGFDEYRRNIRGQSGCEMVPVENAAQRLGQVLGASGTVALITDHHVEERGMPVTFLGLPTKVLRSVGLLAWRYEADVVVAALRRAGEPFQFNFVVGDVIHFADAAGQHDAVEYVTHRYLRAMEKLILEEPAQYLWAYARWGEQLAQQITGEPESPKG